MMKTRTLLIAIGLTLFGLLALSSRQGMARAAAAEAVVLTATPTPLPALNTSMITYTIQSGDTWLVISKKFGVSAGRLLDINGLRSRPNDLFVGEVIRVPISLGFTPSFVNPFLYTVQRDETVDFISAKFFIDKTGLREANRLRPTTQVVVGQVILIPAGPHRYVVQRGDTIQSIAALFNTTVSRLLQFNSHLGDGGLLFPGNNVFVPIAYDVPTFIPAPGFAAPTITAGAPLTTGEGIGGGGEGIGGGGEGIGGGGDSTTGFTGGSTEAANAFVVTAVEFITMPQNVVDLGQELRIRWVSVNHVRRDPNDPTKGIVNMVIEFRGGNGTYRVQQLVEDAGLKPLTIRGVFVKSTLEGHWNDIEFEFTTDCENIVGSDVVITSGSVSFTNHFEAKADCPPR